jgi:hypothetical protein
VSSLAALNGHASSDRRQELAWWKDEQMALNGRVLAASRS